MIPTGAFDVAVMGVPTDEGSPFMGGSRFGPLRIREHSLRFWAGGQGYFDVSAGEEGEAFLVREQTEKRIVDAGDSDVIEGCPQWTMENAQDLCAKLLTKVPLLVVLGGDHAITLPIVRAYDQLGEDFHVIHFDAHLDYMPFVHSGPDGTGPETWAYSNGHAFRWIKELKHVKTLTQVGIRSIRNPKACWDEALRDGCRVVTMKQFRAGGAASVAASLPAGSKVYVSIDVDVLDISLCPGCVSGEPNGMYYEELRDTLAAIAESHEVLGFDFVEVNPQLDVGTGATSYLGAHTVIDFLGRICAAPRWAQRREAFHA